VSSKNDDGSGMAVSAVLADEVFPKFERQSW
jgi:hypothetical protein